jgi:hypothetical protein
MNPLGNPPTGAPKNGQSPPNQFADYLYQPPTPNYQFDFMKPFGVGTPAMESPPAEAMERPRIPMDDFSLGLYPEDDFASVARPNRGMSVDQSLERGIMERNLTRTASPRPLGLSPGPQHILMPNPVPFPLVQSAQINVPLPNQMMTHEQMELMQQIQLQRLQQQHLQNLHHQMQQQMQQQQLQQQQMMQLGMLGNVAMPGMLLSQPTGMSPPSIPTWGYGNPVGIQGNHMRETSSPTTTPSGAYGRFRTNSEESSVPTPGSNALSNSASPNPHHLSPYGNQQSPSSHGSIGSLSSISPSGTTRKPRKLRSRSETANSNISFQSTGLSHVRIESDAKHKKYVCNHDGCGKGFSSSGHLSRHVRIHLGAELAAALGGATSDGTGPKEVPGMNGTVVDTDGSIKFPCPGNGCSSLFGRKDNLRSHYKHHFDHSPNEDAMLQGLDVIADYKEIKIVIHNGIGHVVSGDDQPPRKRKGKDNRSQTPAENSPVLMEVPQIRHIPATPNSIAISASQSSIGSQMLPGVSSGSIGHVSSQKSMQPEKLITDLKSEFDQILSNGKDSLRPKSPLSPQQEANDLLTKIATLQQKLMVASDQIEKHAQPRMSVSPSSGMVVDQGRLESLIDMPGTAQTNEFLRLQVQKMVERGNMDLGGSSTASIGTMNAANLLLGIGDDDEVLASPTTQQMATFLANLPKNTLTPENWFGQGK